MDVADAGLAVGSVDVAVTGVTCAGVRSGSVFADTSKAADFCVDSTFINIGTSEAVSSVSGITGAGVTTDAVCAGSVGVTVVSTSGAFVDIGT